MYALYYYTCRDLISDFPPLLLVDYYYVGLLNTEDMDEVSGTLTIPNLSDEQDLCDIEVRIYHTSYLPFYLPVTYLPVTYLPHPNMVSKPSGYYFRPLITRTKITSLYQD